MLCFLSVEVKSFSQFVPAHADKKSLFVLFVFLFVCLVVCLLACLDLFVTLIGRTTARKNAFAQHQMCGQRMSKATFDSNHR